MDAELEIPNYKIYMNDRNSNGGGSCIYVHVRHTAQVMENVSTHDLVGLTVFLDSGKLHLVCLNQSPSSTVDQDAFMTSEIAKLPSADTARVILLGDLKVLVAS